MLPPGAGIEARFAQAHDHLGNLLREQGKPNEAAACYRRGARSSPAFAEAHYGLGNVLGQQGALDEATACYRRELELRPQFAEAHHSLGNVLREKGELDEAARCYRRARSKADCSPDPQQFGQRPPEPGETRRGGGGLPPRLR